MHTVLQKLSFVKNKISEIVDKKQLNSKPQIIVVTKKFPLSKINPLIENGHIHFGENKIQEAEEKWSDLRKNSSNLQLHLVGSLQSNKAKRAVKIFDYIHSLDNSKLALKISQYEKELNKKVKIFIQVNLAEENQKSGISLNELNNFYSYCTKDLSLNIVGLMCLPPLDSNPTKYFVKLKEAATKLNLKDLSMGMSSDFEQAIICQSTFLRLGTIIMGNRPA